MSVDAVIGTVKLPPATAARMETRSGGTVRDSKPRDINPYGPSIRFSQAKTTNQDADSGVSS